MKWLECKINGPDEGFREQARARQAELTKPPGSLGRLEGLAIELAAIQRTVTPTIDPVHISVFAADHGIVEEGVSAFPKEVTRQMVVNYAAGGACINVLARQLGASLEVVDVGICGDPVPGSMDARVASGTRNCLLQDAMTVVQRDQAMLAGRAAAQRAAADGCQLFVGGEMGIANTTIASGLLVVLTGRSSEDVVGTGTGIDGATRLRKISVVNRIGSRYAGLERDPLELLRCAGGFEIAALTGAYISCAQLGIPVLVDGLMCAVAALLAVSLKPAVKSWLLFAHCSREPGNALVLEQLQVSPLLRLDMALGEASGAAMAVPLLRSACALHNQMATFTEALVAGKLPPGA